MDERNAELKSLPVRGGVVGIFSLYYTKGMQATQDIQAMHDVHQALGCLCLQVHGTHDRADQHPCRRIDALRYNTRLYRPPAFHPDAHITDEPASARRYTCRHPARALVRVYIQFYVIYRRTVVMAYHCCVEDVPGLVSEPQACDDVVQLRPIRAIAAVAHHASVGGIGVSIGTGDGVDNRACVHVYHIHSKEAHVIMRGGGGRRKEGEGGLQVGGVYQYRR